MLTSNRFPSSDVFNVTSPQPVSCSIGLYVPSCADRCVRIGQSNADDPAETIVLYDPAAPASQRFTTDFPVSQIARMYHSTSTLLPDGRIMLAGSNPNADVSVIEYPTEYRVEYLSPPYLFQPRPTYSGLPKNLPYNKNFELSVALPKTGTVTVALIDLGFQTHGVGYNQRYVTLEATLSKNRRTLTVAGPPNTNIYPPGPGFLFVLCNNIPSVAQKVMVGSGAAPAFDAAASKSTHTCVRS